MSIASSVFILGDATIFTEWREDAGATLLLRVWDRPTAAGATEGTPLTRAQISSISITAKDLWSDDTTLSATEIDKNAAVFDTPLAWAEDSTGFNFRYNVPASAFPSKGHKYQVAVTWTLADGRVGKTIWEGIAQ